MWELSLPNPQPCLQVVSIAQCSPGSAVTEMPITHLITCPLFPLLSHMVGLGPGSALGCPPGKALGGEGQQEIRESGTGGIGEWIVLVS